MKKLSNKFIIVVIVLGMTFMALGATFAFYTINISSSGNINVNTYNFNIGMSLSTVKSGNLIPLSSTLIDRTIASNNKCIDLNNNNICSYYQIDLNNSGVAENLVGYIKTESGTTYTSNHLHYKLYNSSYVAVSGEGVIDSTVGSMNYIQYNNSNLNISVPVGNSTYYLVLWLSDIGDNQLDDIDKSFVGSIEFTNINGANLSARFNS